MCGVAAMFAYHYAAPAVDTDELGRIRDSMSHRGPDGEGEWVSLDGRVGLGHRRLAIIDLSDKAAQPMKSRDGTLVVSFNGEIYNYRRLRRELEEKGCVFQSQSDTEVLIHLYREKGDALAHDLRGMFAFALWDAAKKRMLLARDPYGIKPLYYADDGWCLRVASQVKALLAGGRISKAIEPAGAAGFFLMGSVPEPFTLYREIRQVPAGCLVTVDEFGVSEPKPYCSITEGFGGGWADNGLLSLEASGQNMREFLLDSVRQHLVADVPVGLFLSGGIDSGSLAGFLADAGAQGVQTVTLSFEEFQGSDEDETLPARELSERYGASHHARLVRASESKRELPRFFDAMDQPSIDGLNTYFVSKAAAEIGIKVALSGLGGDELFGGYPSFHQIPRLVRALAIPSRIPFAGEVFRHVFPGKISGALKYGGSYAGAYFLRRGLFMPWELEPILGQDQAREGLQRLNWLDRIRRTLTPDPASAFGRVASMESSLYLRNQLLRDADWAGMAHSVEIRTPWVDAVLLKNIARRLISMNGSGGKKILARGPRLPLPESAVQRKKTGFTVPVGRWLESDKELDEWKGVDELRRPDCHWSRRWAYTVYRRLCPA